MNVSVSVYVINSIESVRFCSGNNETIKCRLQRDDFVGVILIAVIPYWKSDFKLSESRIVGGDGIQLTYVTIWRNANCCYCY